MRMRMMMMMMRMRMRMMMMMMRNFEFYWSMLLKQLDQKEIRQNSHNRKAKKNGTLALPIRQLELTTRNCTILKR